MHIRQLPEYDSGKRPVPLNRGSCRHSSVKACDDYNKQVRDLKVTDLFVIKQESQQRRSQSDLTQQYVQPPRAVIREAEEYFTE